MRLLFILAFIFSFNLFAGKRDVQFSMEVSSKQTRKELDEIKALIEEYSYPGTVTETATNERGVLITEFTSVLKNHEALNKIRSSLPDNFEDLGLSADLKIRTARLSGSLQTSLKFKILPGSELFYTLDGKSEFPVPNGSIDSYGNVSFNIQLPDQKPDFVYARALKGRSTRYIKINVSSGRFTEINPDDYPKIISKD